MDIATQQRLTFLASAVVGLSFLGYVAMTAGTTVDDHERVQPVERSRPAPHSEASDTNLPRDNERAAAVAAPLTVPATSLPGVAATTLAAASGSLTLRDSFFDVALAQDPPIDVALWADDEWRAAFIVNQQITEAAAMIHDVDPDCPSLEVRLKRMTPCPIPPGDVDTWALVTAVDAVEPPHIEHGDDMDQEPTRVAAFALQARLEEINPFMQLAAERNAHTPDTSAGRADK